MGIVLTGIKLATGIAAEIGVGTMTANAIMKLIPVTASKATKVCCYTAGAGVAGVAGKAVHKYYDETFDAIAMIPELHKLSKEEREELEEYRKKLEAIKEKEEEK